MLFAVAALVLTLAVYVVEPYWRMRALTALGLVISSYVLNTPLANRRSVGAIFAVWWAENCYRRDARFWFRISAFPDVISFLIQRNIRTVLHSGCCWHHRRDDLWFLYPVAKLEFAPGYRAYLQVKLNVYAFCANRIKRLGLFLCVLQFLGLSKKVLSEKLSHDGFREDMRVQKVAFLVVLGVILVALIGLF